MSEIRCEEANMEALRKQAAKSFGVTVIGRDMTLRMTGPGGEHLEFSFVLTRASDSSVRCCDSCGARADRFYKSKRKIQDCSGWVDISPAELCYDCWCPK